MTGAPGISMELPQQEKVPDAAVSVEAALKLAEGQRNEEKVLGLALLLRHHNGLLLDAERGRAQRARLKAAVTPGESSFVCRLLQSTLPLQRLALGLLTVLLAGPEEEAQEVCLSPGDAAQQIARAAEPRSDDKAECWGPEELGDALDVLRRLLDLSPPKEDFQLQTEGSRCMLTLLTGSEMLSKEDVAARAVALAELLLRDFLGLQGAEVRFGLEALALAECVVREPALRGTAAQSEAIAVLARASARQYSPTHLDEVISACMAGGALAQRNLLELAAALLNAHGVALGQGSKTPLARLKPLLVLASGELRMALEGYGSKEGLCAACMMLEAAVVALGKDSEELEQGNLEEVSECLRELHRALQDIFDYCADIPAEATTTAPEELAVLVRVVAAFQLEDSRHFASEFQKALTKFRRLEPLEFKALLPCLQELQDWHSLAMAKVLEVAKWGLEMNAAEVWRQCAMMVAEVALDAAVYLPDVSIPEVQDVKKVRQAAACAPPELALARSILGNTRVPRPLPAADADHEGAQRLCQWSMTLWQAGRDVVARGGAPLWELALLCGSLLTSVPDETVAAWWKGQGADMWKALSECLLSKEVEASTARLAVRLAGFNLDRHAALAQALHASAGRLPPDITELPVEDSEDEWGLADRTARSDLQAFLAAAAKLPLSQAESSPPEALDGLD